MKFYIFLLVYATQKHLTDFLPLILNTFTDFIRLSFSNFQMYSMRLSKFLNNDTKITY